ncbi:MAG TPA: Gfo/Idh/MocA family oxidoreductase [Tepidisphaeraceae bacterium]|nr:Gfo/Idh/MocA family oxidoreductase [Tepidisphaeraceae bacterium]
MSNATRRQFLRNSGILAMAAAGAGPLLRTSRAQTTAPEKKLGFAIVGLGRFGAGKLLAALPECKYARPAALVSGSPDKAKDLANKYGIPAKSIYNYENFDAIKDNPDVDVVFVVLPNSMHCEFTVRAAKAGKHVMCEKPMAVTAAECHQMIDACKQADRKLMIGYRLRYEPYNMRAIELVQSKANGAARMIESGNAFNIGPNEWRTDKKLAGGGPVMDLGVYSINASRYLLGEEPTHVTAQVWQPKDDPRFRTTEAQMAFSMRFPSGAISNCTTSYCHQSISHYRVLSEHGELRMEPAFGYGGQKLRVRGRGKNEEIDFPQVNHFVAEMDHFAQCILNNTDPRTPGEDGLRDVHIMEKLYQAVEQQKWVAV